MNLIRQLEKEQIAKLSAGKDIPDFQPGDTVLVNVKVVEGERSRIQAYEGVCIGRAGSRPQRELHGAQDFLRRGRRARVPALFADGQLDQGRAPRQGAPRQALLPARPARQARPHHREAGPPRRGPRRRKRLAAGASGAARLCPACALAIAAVFQVATAAAETIPLRIAKATPGFDERTQQPIITP